MSSMYTEYTEEEILGAVRLTDLWCSHWAQAIKTTNASTVAAQERETVDWVQCNKCNKWRKLLPGVDVDSLPDVWYCSLNTWDNRFASCSAAEQSESENEHAPLHSPLPISSVTSPIDSERGLPKKKEKKKREQQQSDKEKEKEKKRRVEQEPKEQQHSEKESEKEKEKEKENEQQKGSTVCRCRYMVWGEQCAFQAVAENDFCFTHLSK